MKRKQSFGHQEILDLFQSSMLALNGYTKTEDWTELQPIRVFLDEYAQKHNLIRFNNEVVNLLSLQIQEMEVQTLQKFIVQCTSNLGTQYIHHVLPPNYPFLTFHSQFAQRFTNREALQLVNRLKRYPNEIWQAIEEDEIG